MNLRAASLLFVLSLGSACAGPGNGGASPPVAWQSFGPGAFARASAERRLVLLDLGAKWCHWCHVMEEETYGDEGVRRLLDRSFVAIQEDADRRLDLATRYQEQGWPATIVFDAEGRELWKHRGFVAAERFRAVLQRLVDAPEPLADAARPEPLPAAGGLTATIRAELEARLEALWDEANGGFGFVHKYLDLPAAEWLLRAAANGDSTARARLLRMLDAERALHDVAWGGAFQYSHGGVWTNPHFEKVMVRQHADLRAYSLAFGAFGREDDLAASRDVARYLLETLRGDTGAFFASQDADLVPGEHAADYFALPDAARRALGVPRIERSQWSRENGLAIAGLCALLAVAPDPELEAAVQRAAEWIVVHRRRPDGTFAHGDSDVAGPFLADSLEMAGALAALAEVTAERRWLDLAVQTVRSIDGAFGRDLERGYATAVGDGVLPAVFDRTENVALARIANRIAHATGDPTSRAVAARAFRAVSGATVALQPGLSAELLLLDAEFAAEPTHVVIVGDGADPAARELFATALRCSPAFRIVERIRPGATAADGAIFPAVDRAAAFVCRDGACSAPVDDAAVLCRMLRSRADGG